MDIIDLLTILKVGIDIISKQYLHLVYTAMS